MGTQTIPCSVSPGSGVRIFALPDSMKAEKVLRLAETQAKSNDAASPTEPAFFLVKVPSESRHHLTANAIQNALAQLDKSSRLNRFIKVGDTWELTYAGVTARGIKDAKGLRYIQYLLAHENKWFELSPLSRSVDPLLPGPEDEHDLGKMNDEEQEENRLFLHDRLQSIQRHYSPDKKRRLLERKHEMERDLNDEQAPLSVVEREQLTEQVTAIDQVLKYNNTFADARSRLRKSVSKLITEAIGNRIAPHHPILARHLKLCIEMGWDYRYLPEQPQHWMTNFQPITNATRKVAMLPSK